jgi:hypothetical protein
MQIHIGELKQLNSESRFAVLQIAAAAREAIGAALAREL